MERKEIKIADITKILDENYIQKIVGDRSIWFICDKVTKWYTYHNLNIVPFAFDVVICSAYQTLKGIDYQFDFILDDTFASAGMYYAPTKKLLKEIVIADKRIKMEIMFDEIAKLAKDIEFIKKIK